MPSDATRDALADMRENGLRAQRFVSGLDAAQFAADERTFFAVARCLEIISEASRRVRQEVKQRHPLVAWGRLAAAGNVYRHEYGRVRPDLVWGTAQEALPVLLAAVEAELGTAP